LLFPAEPIKPGSLHFDLNCEKEIAGNVGLSNPTSCSTNALNSNETTMDSMRMNFENCQGMNENTENMNSREASDFTTNKRDRFVQNAQVWTSSCTTFFLAVFARAQIRIRELNASSKIKALVKDIPVALRKVTPSTPTRSEKPVLSNLTLLNHFAYNRVWSTGKVSASWQPSQHGYGWRQFGRSCPSNSSLC
jgi:hypothetical protein